MYFKKKHEKQQKNIFFLFWQKESSNFKPDISSLLYLEILVYFRCVSMPTQFQLPDNLEYSVLALSMPDVSYTYYFWVIWFNFVSILSYISNGKKIKFCSISFYNNSFNFILFSGLKQWRMVPDQSNEFWGIFVSFHTISLNLWSCSNLPIKWSTVFCLNFYID